MIINSCHKFKFGQIASVVLDDVLSTVRIKSILNGLYRGNFIYEADIIERPAKKVLKMTFAS